MDKAALRKKYKQLRANLSDSERAQRSLDIANQALTLDIWDRDCYHIFLPIARLNEVDTSFLLSILNGKDKEIVISKSDFASHTMQHILLLDSTPIRVNSYGIPEPEKGIQIDSSQIDVVFLPLLAYDQQGNRVGYGKGFYDRMLSECRPDLIKVGLSFFEAEPQIITTNSTDLPMNYCISPKNCYRF